jgi:hypothetical protein
MVTTNILISLLGVLKLYCPALNYPDTFRELFFHEPGARDRKFRHQVTASILKNFPPDIPTGKEGRIRL